MPNNCCWGLTHEARAHVLHVSPHPKIYWGGGLVLINIASLWTLHGTYIIPPSPTPPHPQKRIFENHPGLSICISLQAMKTAMNSSYTMLEHKVWYLGIHWQLWSKTTRSFWLFENVSEGWDHSKWYNMLDSQKEYKVYWKGCFDYAEVLRCFLKVYSAILLPKKYWELKPLNRKALCSQWVL